MTDLQLTTRPGGAAVLDETTVRAFAQHLHGDLLTPDDAGYDAARVVWNGAVDHRPGLIVRCHDASDVARAVRLAHDHELLLAVKGGAHNVAGTAICDGGLVIDLSPLKAVHVDPGARVAHAGGGATWAELDRATQAHGLATPGGVVSTTGIAGLTLGGGLGWLRRRHGLSCDNLEAVEIVTADGEIRRASASENPDLFWAVRGGGGNFGVVTSFAYRLHPVGPDVMFAFVFYPAETGRTVLQGWREYCADAPDEVSSFAICGTVPDEEPFSDAVHRRPYVMLAAAHAGSVEDGERVLQPLRELGAPLCDFSGPMPYVEVQALLDADYPTGRRYYWKSLYLDALGDDAIDTVLALAAERPSPLSTVDVWQLGGAMGRVAPGATAFASRAAPFLFGVESNWDDPGTDEQNVAWTREACVRMAPFSSGGSYLNFEPRADDLVRAAYGSHYERLAALKARYDPQNLFRLNQNIQPALQSKEVL